MRSQVTNDQMDDFLVQPFDLPGSGTMAPVGGFCDGCSGCKVVDVWARGPVVVARAEFLVQPLVMPGPVGDPMEAWCGGCAGCSAACRSQIG